MPLLWNKLTSEQEKFFTKWENTMARTTSPFIEEAKTAAAMANEMLAKRGLTRRDVPKKCWQVLKYLGVPEKIGNTFLRGINSERNQKIFMQVRLTKILTQLGGSATNRKIYTVYITKHGPISTAAIRAALQRGRDAGSFSNPERGIWKLI